MYYYGYTNEKTDKAYFKNTLKTFDYISPLQKGYPNISKKTWEDLPVKKWEE